MDTFWLWLVLSTVTDFLLPEERVNKNVKKRSPAKATFLWFTIPVVYFVAAVLFAPVVYIWVFLFASGTHLLLTLSRQALLNRGNAAFRFFTYLIEQVSRIFLFYLLVHLAGIIEASPSLSCKFGIDFIQRVLSEVVLFKVFVFFYSTLTGSQWMRVLLDVVYRGVPEYWSKLCPEEEELTEIAKAVMTGKTIGILERALIFIFVSTGNLSSIPFIVTAKSLARFRQLNDRDFAEYYLIGTLFSVLIALCGGYLVRML
jgi:hypothetical protein